MSSVLLMIRLQLQDAKRVGEHDKAPCRRIPTERTCVLLGDPEFEACPGGSGVVTAIAAFHDV
jgi:hypothetical protein